MMKVKVITPMGLYGQFEVSKIHTTTALGECAILPNHMPVVATIRTSRLLMTIDGKEEVFAISNGLLQMRNNEVRILADAFEGKAEIDLQRAIRAKERAERRLAKKDANTSIRRAEVALERALNRISIASNQ